MKYLRPAMRSMAQGLFDRGDGIPSERLDWMIGDAESFLASAGPRTSWLFRAVMLVIELLPLFFIGRLSRFSRLSPEQRDRFLAALDESRLAILIALPKAVLSLVYYEHPDALAETGYDGTCLMGDLPKGVGLVQLPARVEVSR